MSFYGFAKVIACNTLNWFFKVRIEGKENIPPEGGYILCANHRTYACLLYTSMGGLCFSMTRICTGEVWVRRRTLSLI